MKHVIIAIDYNPSAEKVVSKGYELAKLMNAEVTLLHVISDIRFYNMQYPSFMGYDAFSIPVNIEVKENLVQTATNFVEATKNHLEDPSVMIKVEEGDPAQVILQVSKKMQADILVMGTHSHSALEKLFMGTVASSVLERTEIPVYLVPIKK